jgi:hypothetical protein
VSGETLAAGLVVGQQEHSPPAGTHLVLLAGVVVVALTLFGMKWWRGRRDAAAPEEHSDTRDRSAKSTRSTEDE